MAHAILEAFALLAFTLTVLFYAALLLAALFVLTHRGGLLPPRNPTVVRPGPQE